MLNYKMLKMIQICYRTTQLLHSRKYIYTKYNWIIKKLILYYGNRGILNNNARLYHDGTRSTVHS